MPNFFTRKARALVAAFAIAAGAGGGAYIAHEQARPVQSEFTLASAEHIRGMDEDRLLNGRLPMFSSMDAASQKAREKTILDMTQQIDAMERMKGALDPETAGALQTAAVDFVNTLRLSENLTESDYAKLLKEYNTRVGLDVTAQAGNYNIGIVRAQECNYATAFANIFSFDDEDEQTPAERAKDIGMCMTDPEGQMDAYLQEKQAGDKAELGGGAAGAALGGLGMLALFRRRRTPPIQKGPGSK